MIITAANSDRFRILANKLLSDEFVCLELTATTTLECDRERFLKTGEIAKSATGVVIACEADVGFRLSDLEIPHDRITVEKGHRRLEQDRIAGASGWSPWAGFISCPAEWMPELCHLIVRAMDVVVKDPCLALYFALQASGRPWELRSDTAFWPRKAAITHYHGTKAKLELLKN